VITKLIVRTRAKKKRECGAYLSCHLSFLLRPRGYLGMRLRLHWGAAIDVRCEEMPLRHALGNPLGTTYTWIGQPGIITDEPINVKETQARCT
jgi:hypothetical protein